MPIGLWLLTGLILSALVITFYYLSKQPAWNNNLQSRHTLNQSEMTANKRSHSADHQGATFPSLSKDTTHTDQALSSPRFTFYQELSDPPTENRVNSPDVQLIPTEPNSEELNLSIETGGVTIIEETSTKQASLEKQVIPPQNKALDEDASSLAIIETEAQEITRKPLSDKQYILQTGAFKDQLQADRQRAKLLLQGFDANIKSVTLTNGTIWHRVLIGPFDKTRAAQLQSQLEQQSITSQLRAHN